MKIYHGRVYWSVLDARGTTRESAQINLSRLYNVSPQHQTRIFMSRIYKEGLAGRCYLVCNAHCLLGTEQCRNYCLGISKAGMLRFECIDGFKNILDQSNRFRVARSFSHDFCVNLWISHLHEFVEQLTLCIRTTLFKLWSWQLQFLHGRNSSNIKITY